jgi:predicted NBD/HSP70 family sugar kinase
VVVAGRVTHTGRSGFYERPSAHDLIEAVRSAVAGAPPDAGRVGLCVPGVLGDDRLTVRQSVNVPALNELRLDDLVASALGRRPESLTVLTDANATAIDLYAARGLSGRLFVLAIGAGVGAAVVDEGRPLSVDGDSPGHFGQIDVSIEDHPVVGPDHGAGGLEGYVSAAALARRYGQEHSAWATRMRPNDPPMLALARAVRIAHALYRPHHVILAGGIGIRLGPLVPELRSRVEDRLTNIARPGWTLSTGDSDFHAAAGAAKVAMRRG